MQGYFVNITEKVGGEIVKSSPIYYDPTRTREYLDKIEYYLPRMLALHKGEVECESYPRRTLYAFNCPCGMCDYASLCLHGDIIGYTLKDENKKVGKHTIFLSPTQLLRYETCPRQWAYYAAGYRTETSAAKLQFGDAIHNAIEAYIRLGRDPKESFSFFWGEFKDAQLTYTKKGTNHEYFQKAGESMMEKFPAFYDQEIITGLDVSEAYAEVPDSKLLWDNYIGHPVQITCKPDLVCKTHDGDTLIIDWKVTSRKNHDEDWLPVADQMTAYFLLTSHL